MKRLAPSRRTVQRWWIGAAVLASAALPVDNLQNSAFAAAPPAPAEAAAPLDAPAGLGRLFYTPERRQALDRQRASNRPAERQVDSRRLSFDGLVQRSGGQRTVWVNGRPLTERDEGVLRVAPRPGQPGRARITIPNEGGHELAVGSSVDRDSGEVRTPLGGGRVVRSGAR